METEGALVGMGANERGSSRTRAWEWVGIKAKGRKGVVRRGGRFRVRVGRVRAESGWMGL